MGAASYHSINHAIIIDTTGVITGACWQKRKIMNEKRADLV
jgi:polynucleotide 5'-kinase involved in rRNA processing